VNKAYLKAKNRFNGFVAEQLNCCEEEPLKTVPELGTQRNHRDKATV
jgi:hypothetical protein